MFSQVLLDVLLSDVENSKHSSLFLRSGNVAKQSSVGCCCNNYTENHVHSMIVVSYAKTATNALNSIILNIVLWNMIWRILSHAVHISIKCRATTKWYYSTFTSAGHMLNNYLLHTVWQLYWAVYYSVDCDDSGLKHRCTVRTVLGFTWCTPQTMRHTEPNDHRWKLTTLSSNVKFVFNGGIWY